MFQSDAADLIIEGKLFHRFFTFFSESFLDIFIGPWSIIFSLLKPDWLLNYLTRPTPVRRLALSHFSLRLFPYIRHLYEIDFSSFIHFWPSTAQTTDRTITQKHTYESSQNKQNSSNTMHKSWIFFDSQQPEQQLEQQLTQLKQ